MHKPEWLSKGAEILLEEWKDSSRKAYDVVVVGSGYGGAVAAARLAARMDEKGNPLSVCVLERGREHLPRTFPSTFAELPGHVRFSRFDDPVPMGVRDGLFDVRIGEDVSVVVANGLGGGSLFNAGVVAPPHWDVFDEEWPRSIRESWGRELSLERDDYYRRAREQLGVAELGEGLAKAVAFEKFAARLGPAPARVAVDKDTCKKCGNCASGCNFGAKRTLAAATGYLAKAFERGARIYTGATVSHIERRSGEWAVLLGLTVQPCPLKRNPLHEIRAKTVILAAGALGSTEILMRSAARGGLGVSKCLGGRFSANGDMISAIYDQATAVNASPRELEGREDVGPTITRIARSGTTQEDRVVVEELAIPAALRRIFEEVVTTSAMLQGLARRDEKAHGLERKDPAAVDPDAVDRTQILAAMGDDGAKGALEMVPGWRDADDRHVNDGAIRIRWRNAGNEPIYAAQDKLLRELAEVNGGTYLPSPLWRPLPKALSEQLSGPKPAGLVLSMHPLGGCRMADSAEQGVVDHMGRVFDGTGGVHDGLLVLDGSIVPTALGINPLLTITALAERAIELYSAARGWTERAARPVQLPPVPVIERRRPGRSQARPPAAQTALRLSERMTGQLAFAKGAPPVDVELTLHFAPQPDIAAFLQDPRRELVLERGTLRVKRSAANVVPEIWDEAPVEGKVRLLAKGAGRWQDRAWRALVAYRDMRLAGDVVSLFRERGEGVPLWARALAWLANRLPRFIGEKGVLWLLERHPKSRAYVDLASQIGETRHLLYRFEVKQPLQDAAGVPAPRVIAGQKTLRYCADGNPWRQLTDLVLTADPEGPAPTPMGTLTVDPAYFFQGFSSQLRFSALRDLPSAWMDLASLGLFIARILLKVHFWSFRLPEYQKYDPMRDIRRLPGELEPLRMERHVVGYPETPQDAGIFLPVTRYRAASAKDDAPAVVLFHGLGSGGIQFATPLARPNMAEYLAGRGFDVWVAELRTSIALPYSLDQWSLDEVARGDIPRIVDFVLKETRASQVSVVAHCIGSAMFCTAVLDGRLQHDSGMSKIGRAVLLQVGPLITLSAGTRLRGLVGAPLRRFLPEGHVDFSVDDRAGWVGAIIDRLLTTYPYPPEQAKHHRLGWSWRHNAHMANCNRWAGIDGRMFEHENLTEQMLDGLGDVLGHSSLTTWAQTLQYAFLERLTDSEGRNAYVTADNVRRFFTFPVLFLHGAENDVFHPLTSIRSAELLRRFHGADAARVLMLRGYGHFDPLIGRHAARDVFLEVADALAAETKAAASPVARAMAPDKPTEHSDFYYVRRPLIGPVVGWVRPDAGGTRWTARLWCRIDDLRSPVTCAVLQAFLVEPRGGARHPLPPKIVWYPTEATPKSIDSLVSGAVDTTLCVDMDLGETPGTYEIVVLSIHESVEAQGVSEEQRRAELSAGKQTSAESPAMKVGWLRTPQQDEAAADTARKLALAGALREPGMIDDLRRKTGGKPGEPAKDEKIDRAIVNVPDSPAADSLCLALASCRYPGWLVDRDLADAAFGEVRKLTERDGAPPSALLLIGDQIYADATAGAFDPKDRRERFYEAYREAWCARNAREVLSNVPSYMMMDDHEAGNDWHPADAATVEEKAMREDGLDAFRRYQWSHSPGNAGQPKAPPGAEPEIFYYQFDLRGFPVFVCDTRSGRSPGGILDDRQYRLLIDWLEKAQAEAGDKPKFVVSPSVVLPLMKDAARVPAYAMRSDGWDAFPAQLASLFEFIRSRSVENVVLVCGDSHLSMHSRFHFVDAHGDEGGPQGACIMASPMYAPYPFANAVPDQYLMQGSLALPGGASMRYEVVDRAAGSAFTRLCVTREAAAWRIEAEILPHRLRSELLLPRRSEVGQARRPAIVT